MSHTTFTLDQMLSAIDHADRVGGMNVLIRVKHCAVRAVSEAITKHQLARGFWFFPAFTSAVRCLPASPNPNATILEVAALGRGEWIDQEQTIVLVAVRDRIYDRINNPGGVQIPAWINNRCINFEVSP